MAIYIDSIAHPAPTPVGEHEAIEAKHVILHGKFLKMIMQAQESCKASRGFVDDSVVWRESLEALREVYSLDDLNLFAKEVSRTKTYARIGIFLNKKCAGEVEFEFRIKRENTFKGTKKVLIIADSFTALTLTVQSV